MPRFARLRSRLRLPAALLLLGGGSALGCGDGELTRKLLGRAPTVDVWARDSAMLAADPTLLLRLVPESGGARVVPIATLGAQGFRPLALSGRGWRSVDRALLQGGNVVHPVMRDRTGPPLRMFQGYWQPQGGTLDTVPRCGNPIPFGYAITSEGRGTLPLLALDRERGDAAPRVRVSGIAAGERDRTLATIPTLVAPAAGIKPSELARYERRVHEVPSGVNGGSTLLVEYNDPVPPPDSAAAFGERPRQLIVALDEGIYGYRTTWTHATVGAPRTRPRLRFIDWLDADGDGKPELFFGLYDAELAPLYTLALRYENDAWRQVFEFVGGRCTPSAFAP